LSQATPPRLRATAIASAERQEVRFVIMIPAPFATALLRRRVLPL
jgi:hypothetical protein